MFKRVWAEYYSFPAIKTQLSIVFIPKSVHATLHAKIRIITLSRNSYG